MKHLKINSSTETMLIELHILMSEAIKGYEDRAYMSNKLAEIEQYRNKLPASIYTRIEEFVEENIRPLIYDADYWSYIEKDEQYGSYSEEDNHFIIDSNNSLESIIFRKYYIILGLLMKLSDFMLVEFKLDYE